MATLKKNKWLHNSFEEGLRYVQLFNNEKLVGFIEYTEVEHSSRVVFASNYFVIHCLWVSETGKGYGTKLIQMCIGDAVQQKKNGVIVVTNSKTSWTPSKEIFIKNNFKMIDTAPFDFELLVFTKLESTLLPFFPKDWEKRLRNFSKLTILRSFQCPYVDIATNNVKEAASKLGLEVEIIELHNRDELLRLSPTPYGIYGVVYSGKLISYHRLTVHSVIKRLKELIR